MEEAQLPATPQEQGFKCKGEREKSGGERKGGQVGRAQLQPLCTGVVCVQCINCLLQVRFAVLQVAQEMYSKLGEEFAVLLPETIPFLAELMEGNACACVATCGKKKSDTCIRS